MLTDTRVGVGDDGNQDSAGIGKQGKAFLALMRAEASKRGRRIGGKYLEATIQSAAIYFSAVNILTAYDRAPSGAEPHVLAGGEVASFPFS